MCQNKRQKYQDLSIIPINICNTYYEISQPASISQSSFHLFHLTIIGDEHEITQAESIPSEILSLNKSLNSKSSNICHDTVKSKTNDGQKKIKSKTL